MAEIETYYAAKKGKFVNYISESQAETYIANGYEVAKFTREILGGGSEPGGTSATAKASTKSAVVTTSEETAETASSETDISSDEPSDGESEA